MAEKFDRCRCSGLKFTQINDHAQALHTTSIKRLKRELEMGMYCSACVPYLKEMFKTGQTVFTEADEVTP
ncbi:MAG: (2Fe-2S)-binding protein [Desulfobacterales bacterium]|nr:(2Fe-2S)-binding protein [Desulfobacterales bacterium]